MDPRSAFRMVIMLVPLVIGWWVFSGGYRRYMGKPAALHTQRAGGTKIVMDTPCDLSSLEVELPAPLKARVKKQEACGCNDGEIDLTIIGVSYDDTVTVNVQTAINAETEVVSHLDGVSGLKTTSTPQKIGDRSGFLVSGDFQRFQKPSAIRMLVIAQGTQLWIVRTLYRKSDVNQKDVQRMFDSVKFD